MTTGGVQSDDRTIGERILTAHDKGIPPRAVGMAVDEFLATKPTLADLPTPLLVLDDEALRHNVDLFGRYAASRHFETMPHGKTTMAPALWQRQLDNGATGITIATPGQARTARAHGFSALMLANAIVDPIGLQWLAAETADPDLEFFSWADSVDTVDAMERALGDAIPTRPLDVLVELGGASGRTGARGVPAALAVARRLVASPVLRLAGIAGYEGALAHDRSDAGLAAVRGYLAQMVELHDAILAEELYDEHPVVVTAGGSAYFDEVAEAFSPWRSARPNTRYVLRSGAYITHDDGFYRAISPLDGTPAGGASPRDISSLWPAMRGIARVVSRPEPGLALLDAGKRDLPFDEGLPVPLRASTRPGGGEGSEVRSLGDGAFVSAMNDQHTFLRLPGASNLQIGDVVELGLSHPCTAFDKWRLIPVVADASAGARIVEYVETWF